MRRQPRFQRTPVLARNTPSAAAGGAVEGYVYAELQESPSLLGEHQFLRLSCAPSRMSLRRSSVSDHDDAGAAWESSRANAFSAVCRAKSFSPSAKYASERLS